MRTLFAVCLLAFFTAPASSQEVCTPYRTIATPRGELTITRCLDKKGATKRVFVSVAGEKILEDSFVAEQDFNKARSIWIFQGDVLRQTACPGRLYLVDLTAEKIRVFQFGVENTCTEFHWASWGENRNVVAIKRNVKFVYEDGKLVPPAKNIDLLTNIEPSHADPEMDENKLQPFARELPLPK